jgi:hypothetical protein
MLFLPNPNTNIKSEVIEKKLKTISGGCNNSVEGRNTLKFVLS